MSEKITQLASQSENLSIELRSERDMDLDKLAKISLMESERHKMFLEINKLKGNIDELKEQIENSVKSETRLNFELAEHESKMNLLNNEIQDLQNSLIERQNILIEYEQQIALLSLGEEKYISENMNLKVERDQISREIGEIKENMIKSSKNTNKLEENIRALKFENEQLYHGRNEYLLEKKHLVDEFIANKAEQAEIVESMQEEIGRLHLELENCNNDRNFHSKYIAEINSLKSINIVYILYMYI